MTLRTPVRAAAASLAVLAALGLSACGSDDEPKDEPTASADADDEKASDEDADDILKDAEEALLDASTVALQGTGDDEGTTLDIDLAFIEDDATGTITVDGSAFQILSVEGTSYFSAGADFWTASGIPAEILPTVADKWIIADPANPDFADFASFGDRESFIEDLLKPEGDVEVGEREEIDGVEYIVLIDTDDDGVESKLYIDAETKLPASIESDAASLEFSYDELDAPEAPAADQIVDPATLG